MHQTFVAEPDVETVTLQLAGLELTVSARRLSTAPQSEIEFAVIPGSERPRPSSAPVFPELSENRQEQVLAARTARELAALDLPFLAFGWPTARQSGFVDTKCKDCSCFCCWIGSQEEAGGNCASSCSPWHSMSELHLHCFEGSFQT